jgi:hypothetical protein
MPDKSRNRKLEIHLDGNDVIRTLPNSFILSLRMALKDLSSPEQLVVLQCMKAIADSDAIGDREFQTRLGIDRSVLREIISSWPEIDDSPENSDRFLAVNNCLNEVCHGVHWAESEWPGWFTAPKDMVKRTYRNWLRLAGRSSGGIA